MNMNTQNIKTFTPIVLFNDYESDSQQLSATHNNYTPSNKDRQTQSLIEQHRLKTKEMLAQNAQFWEKEGGGPSKSKFTFISGSVDSDQVHANDSSEKLDSPSKTCYKFRTLFTPTQPTSTMNNYMYEPHTQETIMPIATPMPIDNSYGSVAMTSNSSSSTANTATATAHPLQQRDFHAPYINTISRSKDFINRNEAEENAEEEQDPLITTTFITEPQFHPTYRPNIGRKRRRGNLPKEVTEYLKRWLILHKKHPYPTEREKQKLADETGLMVSQISNWFINARRRILQPLLESEHQDDITNNTEATNETATDAIPKRPRAGSTIDVIPIPAAETGGTPEPTSSTYHHKYIIGHFSNDKDRSRQYSIDDVSLEEEDEEDEETSQHQIEPSKNQVPPPWVLLPTKLPSMHVLDKDLDAFQPE